ncbi:MAG: excinuclease ABC subunit A [Pseudomonadota bacterium]
MDLHQRARWLMLAAGITEAFGLLMAVAAIPALQGPTVQLLDFVFFPLDGAQHLSSDVARLLTGITGALMVGYGALMWLIASEVLVEQPALARRLVLISIGSWFVVDCSMSVAAGAPLNVLLNSVFLLMFVRPVWGLGEPAGELSSA